jgi:hypothetical protein
MLCYIHATAVLHVVLICQSSSANAGHATTGNPHSFRLVSNECTTPAEVKWPIIMAELTMAVWLNAPVKNRQSHTTTANHASACGLSATHQSRTQMAIQRLMLEMHAP